MKRIFRGLWNMAAFGLGFGLAAMALSIFVAPPRVPQVSAKLDFLKVRGADYDVLFLGSSRMKQLVPSIFDGELAKAGVRVRSFNLSADGMRPPEDSYVLEQALAGRTAPLRFVLVEANPVALRLSEEDIGTKRLTYWHDNARMWTIWRRAWSHSLSHPPGVGKRISDTWRQLGFAAGHLEHWLWNSVRMGRGSELLLQAFRLEEESNVSRSLWTDLAGYNPPSPDLPMDRDESEGYLTALAKIHRLGRLLDPMDAASQDHFAGMAALAGKHGARLVIVAPPTTTIEVFEPWIPPSSDLLFLDFSDPIAFPELFEPAVRLNGGHLNGTGCELFTHLVGQHLATELRAAAR